MTRTPRGDTPLEALRFVVDWLVAATVTEPEAKPEAGVALSANLAPALATAA